VVCDRLFEPVVGAACGGPAEDALVARVAAADGTRPFGLEARIDASPRTSISVYRP
jgi:hypothetical protein